MAEELFLNETHNTEILDVRDEDGIFVVSFKQASIAGLGEVEKISQALRLSISPMSHFSLLKCWVCWWISGGE
jgi:hypothetical protein